jgi:hypothetical protein
MATTGLGDQIRQDIIVSLDTRRARPHTALRRLEDGAKSAGKRAWVLAQRHPYAGVAAAAALGIAAASAVGVGELAVGLGIAYAAYNVLKGRETPSQALREIVEDIERA